MPLCAAAVEGLLEMRAERRENIAIYMDGGSLLTTEAPVKNSPVPRLCVQRGTQSGYLRVISSLAIFPSRRRMARWACIAMSFFVRYKDNRVSAFMEFIKQAHDFAAGG